MSKRALFESRQNPNAKSTQVPQERKCKQGGTATGSDAAVGKVISVFPEAECKDSTNSEATANNNATSQNGGVRGGKKNPSRRRAQFDSGARKSIRYLFASSRNVLNAGKRVLPIEKEISKRIADTVVSGCCCCGALSSGAAAAAVAAASSSPLPATPLR